MCIRDSTLIVDALEQLNPFLNDKKVLEIVVRGKNKRIQNFQKVALNELPQNEAKEVADKVLQALGINNVFENKNLNMIQQVARMQNLSIVLNGLNLCGTCAGFAIIYEKLDKMSAEINQQFIQLQHLIKQGTDIQTEYEFKKVLSEHTDMLDARKIQQPYSEEKMRKLVDAEYNVLEMLINVFQKDIAADGDTIIVSIFSLLAMLTVSLCYFDEQYYFNHHEVVGDQNVWHSSHNKWMTVYSTLLSQWFIEKLQDHGMFETKLTTTGVDIYYTELLDQVSELRQEVEDNQKLIVVIGDATILNDIRETSFREVKESIESALKEAFAEYDTPEYREVFDVAMEQVAMM